MWCKLSPSTYVNIVTQLRITMNHINLFLSKTEYIFSCKEKNINHDFLFFNSIFTDCINFRLQNTIDLKVIRSKKVWSKQGNFYNSLAKTNKILKPCQR